MTWRASTLAFALFALGCSGSSSNEAPKPTPEVAEPAVATIFDASSVPALKQAQPPRSPIPDSARQLVITVGREWESFYGVMQRFERRGGMWTPVSEAVSVTLGSAGLAWGAGLHEVPDGAYVKVEGDGKSPAGIFGIGAAYGYADGVNAPLPYQKTSRRWRCVNDSTSRHYNRVVHEAKVEKDWRTSENMRRHDALYEMVIEIDHNHITGDANPRPQAGSCIFFHVWHDRDSPTAGCTAMEREHMLSLLQWMDPERTPIAIFLPENEYDRYRERWGLPQMPSELP